MLLLASPVVVRLVVLLLPDSGGLFIDGGVLIAAPCAGLHGCRNPRPGEEFSNCGVGGSGYLRYIGEAKGFGELLLAPEEDCCLPGLLASIALAE